MSDEWYIEDENRTRGPFTLSEVYELIELGEIVGEAWFELDGERIDLDTLKQQWPDPRRGADVLELIPLPEDDFPKDDVTEPESPGLPTVPDGESQDESDSEPQPLDDLTDETPAPVVKPKAPPKRDCILILGRRRAGKTIYLATLYENLWKSMGGLAMKAHAGPAHSMLTGIADQLRHGLWPEATLGSRRLELELDDNGVKRTIVAFDYSGEDFRRAFVDDDETSAEAAKLLDYLKRAAAVILLIDPAVAVAGKHEEIVEDDFGMVQAVKRIRETPGGENVPITAALTKGDRNREVILSAGSKRDFIMRHYPALVRTLGDFIVFTVSAVQEVENEDGTTRPSPESTPVNVEKPFLHCLELLRKREQQVIRAKQRKAVEQARIDQIRAEEAAISAYNWKAAFLTAGIIVIGLCICVLIWILKTE